jgi:ABC-type glycerol-3-phosphate transport system substrate-binding protein
MKKLLFFWLILILALAGCSGQPFELPAQATATSNEAQPTRTASPTLPETPPQGTPSLDESVATPGQVKLRLWAPPQFDPAGDTPAGDLLQERLEQFQARRPEVQIEVRIKAKDGPGGLFEALTASTAAAQLAMPDLVALPHPLIQSAAIKGLLRPMNGLTNALDDPNWYDFARQLAGVQNSIFGLPFAGDALVQVYRGGENITAGTTWDSALEAATPLAFSAADPQALFTLALYQASGGKFVDEQGGAILETAPLTRVLEFYRAGEQAEVIPFWLTQLQNDDQAWEAFADTRAGAVSTWLSRYWRENVENSAFEQIPTPDGKAATLAGGWVWALTSPDAERRQLAVELAEFLTEGEFLGKWTEAAGMLPPRPSALDAWKQADQAAVLKPIAAAAQLYPAPEILNLVGPIVQEAVIEVLKGQLEPQAAAQGATNRLKNP